MCYGLVAFRLATHARAYAGKRLASPIRYAVTTVFALIASFAARHTNSSRADSVADGVVDLVLNRAISRPSAGHVGFLCAHATRIDNAACRIIVGFRAGSGTR